VSTASTPRASFGTTKKNILAVLVRAQAMYSAILANAAMFASPPIAMAAFLALINALTTAQQAVTATKAKGMATLRNTKRDALWTAMGSLKSYVQGLADGMTAEGAASLIEAAGLLLAKTQSHHKAILTATLTTTPGTVHLVANASALGGKAVHSKKVAFNWQWSSDGGKTWNDAHSTPYANTDLPGLTLMTTYGFRVSVTIAKVAGPWSQAVSLLVH
jgi:hypothetical protein